MDFASSPFGLLAMTVFYSRIRIVVVKQVQVKDEPKRGLCNKSNNEERA